LSPGSLAPLCDRRARATAHARDVHRGQRSRHHPHFYSFDDNHSHVIINGSDQTTPFPNDVIIEGMGGSDVFVVEDKHGAINLVLRGGQGDDVVSNDTYDLVRTYLNSTGSARFEAGPGTDSLIADNTRDLQETDVTGCPPYALPLMPLWISPRGRRLRSGAGEIGDQLLEELDIRGVELTLGNGNVLAENLRISTNQ
jgi:hypothetical protein